MGLKEEWAGLPAQTKMMVIGGGGLATFFLITAIRNKGSQTATQDTGAGPQTQAIDPTASLDAMTSQMQDLQNQIQSMQDGNNQQQTNEQNQYKADLMNLMNKNQQATNTKLQDLINKMGQLKKPVPTTPPPAAYGHPIKGPTHPVIPTPKPVVQAHPIKGPTHPVIPKPKPIVYEAYGKTPLNSSLWGLSKMYVMNHQGAKNPTNAQIQTEVNKVVKINHVSNPNKIQKGQKFRMN